MSSSGVPGNPTSHNVASILSKLNDADPDIRYMTLNDLNKMLETGHATFLSHDYTPCAKVVDGLIHTLNDSNGDVQNIAIKTLGSFIPKAPETILCPTIEKVSNVKTDNSVDTTVAALAVRAIVVSLAHPVAGVPRTQRVQDSYSAVSRALIPRLIGRVVIPLAGVKTQPPKGMMQDDLATGHDSNSLDLLTEVARYFGPMLQDAEVEALEQIVMQVLESDLCGTVMKKKAVVALSSLALYFNDALLSKHVGHTIERLRQSHLTPSQRKLFITVYGSLARSIPQKFGPYLKTLAPFVLSPLSQQELDEQREQEAESDGERDIQIDEVREAALSAIEIFLQSCAQDMRAYTKDVVDTAIRFIKYDPNVADDDDEDMEEDEDEEDDEFADEEDFEEETGFDDEDDISWKVRRCSAKVLHALVESLDSNDPVIYGQLAPVLISRFKEREESVRSEVIATLAYLITKTSAPSHANQENTTNISLPPSRKRRRGYSDVLDSGLRAQQAMLNGNSSPAAPPQQDGSSQGMAAISPEIVRGAVKLLKTSTVPTKQIVISLLKDMIKAQHGALAEQAEITIKPVLETMGTVTGGSSNAANHALRIEGLRLLAAIADSHSSKIIQPHLDQIITIVVEAANDRFAKLSIEAFAAIEALVKALTPPRSVQHDCKAHLSQLYQVIVGRIAASETDTEVRQKAIQSLGLLIGRTSGAAGPNYLDKADRSDGQQVIADRMKNELTRLACIRAIDTIAVLAVSSTDYKTGFVGSVALELGAQLRKASRSLRGASLSALKMLSLSPASLQCMEDSVISELVNLFVPLLKADDLHLLGPALIVLSAFAKIRPNLVATSQVISGICSMMTLTLSGVVLDALVTCVEALGKGGHGKELMSALLNVGAQGDTDATGQVIGTLLVSGGDNVGVKLGDFIRELQTQEDEPKRCLALFVLGEVGLRLGHESSLKPESFTPYFDGTSERVKLAAAVALGRAGAGDVKTYLPTILNGLVEGKQYLLLHSVKELLQHSNAEDDIQPYTKTLWQNIISSGQAEDNKVVGAECIGRLTIIDPTAYLPQLQTFLQNPNPTIRGMVISALRYVCSDTDESYNVHLRGNIIPMLSTMLADSDLDNQRLSLATLNSALHNKPSLVLPSLAEILPAAVQASVIRPELIREVQMGPFKHKVDDGLEIRKSAYETLYALLESPASRQRLDLPAFYDRIVAGLADEHEIKILCCLVLGKLLVISPSESARRLDSLAQQFRAVLAFKPKDNAVKQELEKLAEQNKAVVKTSLVFTKALGADESKSWRDYVEWMRKDFSAMVKAAEEELRESRER